MDTTFAVTDQQFAALNDLHHAARDLARAARDIGAGAERADIDLANGPTVGGWRSNLNHQSVHDFWSAEKAIELGVKICRLVGCPDGSVERVLVSHDDNSWMREFDFIKTEMD